MKTLANLMILFVLLSSCNTNEIQTPTIIFSGNNRLSLEPCGCTVPIGGLARKINYIQNTKAILGKTNVFTVEAGNFLFHKAVDVRPQEGDYLKQLTKLQLDAYADVPYDAIHLGFNDFALGLDYLKSIQKSYNLPLFSANVMDKSGNSPFPAYVMLKSGNKNIVITGVIDKGSKIHDDVILKDPLRTLNKVLTPLIGSYDFCVVLVDGPESMVNEVNDKIRGVDLVIDARTTKQSLSSKKLSNTSYATLGREGKYLGVLELTLGSPDRALDYSSVQKRLQFVDSRLEAYEKKLPDGVSLEEYYKDKKNILKQIKRYQKDKYSQESLLDSIPSWYTWYSAALTKEYDDHAVIDLAFAQIKNKFKELHLGMPVPRY
ncbi:MAG: hypothetical protein KAI81_07335 [Candidatus Marinimicrobia bacterium]|nr:hypothetical protein [Candidatus Neomarinimicrobiota bacterium]